MHKNRYLFILRQKYPLLILVHSRLFPVFFAYFMTEKVCPMKILIIEDEPEMRKSLVHSLTEEQYTLEIAEDYPSALEKIGVYDYDCILLDISLPGGNGLQLLRRLKQLNKAEGVIIVSAKDSLDDKVKGLELGADDYLAKPFHMAELHARVKAVFRRRKLGGNPLITMGNMMI